MGEWWLVQKSEILRIEHADMRLQCGYRHMAIQAALGPAWGSLTTPGAVFRHTILYNNFGSTLSSSGL